MSRKLTACAHEKAIFTIKHRDKLISEAVKVLRTWRSHFDAIAVSGYSSAMTASIVASKLRKNLVLVRKESEERFSNHIVEGQHNQRVLFFDDLIDTGGTFRRIRNGVEKIGCRIVGVYLYNPGFRSIDYLSEDDLIDMNMTKEEWLEYNESKST